MRRLIQAGSSTGIGFDPAYRGPTSALDGRLQFISRSYDETFGELAADVIFCRHVIEHVHRPIPFLRLLYQAVADSPHARVFFETPDIAWIFQHTVIWDLYYEYCSYFSTETITLALELAGFQVQCIQRTFGEQYLWVEATVRDADSVATFPFHHGVWRHLARGANPGLVLTRRNGEGNKGREAFPRKGQDHAESKANVHQGI